METVFVTSFHRCSGLAWNVKENTASLKITNTGNVRSASVVLLYWIPTQAGQGNHPLRRLIGFDQVAEMDGGGSASLTLDLYEEWILNGESNAPGKLVLGGSCASA